MCTFLLVGLICIAFGFILAWFDPCISRSDKVKIKSYLEAKKRDEDFNEVIVVKMRHQFSPVFLRLCVPIITGSIIMISYIIEAVVRGVHVGPLSVIGLIAAYIVYVVNFSMFLNLFCAFSEFIFKDRVENKYEIHIEKEDNQIA